MIAKYATKTLTVPWAACPAAGHQTDSHQPRCTAHYLLLPPHGSSAAACATSPITVRGLGPDARLRRPLPGPVGAVTPSPSASPAGEAATTTAAATPPGNATLGTAPATTLVVLIIKTCTSRRNRLHRRRR